MDPNVVLPMKWMAARFTAASTVRASSSKPAAATIGQILTVGKGDALLDSVAETCGRFSPGGVAHMRAGLSARAATALFSFEVATKRDQVGNGLTVVYV